MLSLQAGDDINNAIIRLATILNRVEALPQSNIVPPPCVQTIQQEIPLG